MFEFSNKQKSPNLSKYLVVLVLSLTMTNTVFCLDDVSTEDDQMNGVFINDSEGSADDDQEDNLDVVQSVDEEIPLPSDNSDDPLLKKKSGKTSSVLF
jgi:hypothetical protein